MRRAFAGAMAIASLILLVKPANTQTAAAPDQLVCGVGFVERQGAMLTCEDGRWAGYLGAYGPSYFGGLTCRRAAQPACPIFVSALMKDGVEKLKKGDTVICVLLTKETEAAYTCWEYNEFKRSAPPH